MDQLKGFTILNPGFIPNHSRARRERIHAGARHCRPAGRKGRLDGRIGI